MTGRSAGDEAFDVSDVNRVRRYAHRAHYDRATVFGILDHGLVAHVGFVVGERPVVIPMTYGHDRERLFLHGASKGRIGKSIAGEAVSVSVALVDGIVLARSLFDSSMNYRSVVIHGRASAVTGRAARFHALRCIADHIMPGRWDEIPVPTEQQLKATMVLAVEVESASAKVRNEGVVEPDGPHAGAVWAGVIPIATTFGVPLADPKVRHTVPTPDSVQRVLDRRRGP